MALINKANTKAALLQMSQEYRNGKFTRVSKSLLDEIEVQQRLLMIDIVKRHPSIGVTLTK
jgi:hypothetical protein